LPLCSGAAPENPHEEPCRATAIGPTTGTGGSNVSGTGGRGSGGTGGTAAACSTDGSACGADQQCVADVFDEPRTIAVGTLPTEISLRDLNGDGHLDAIVVQDSADGIVTLLGAGDGTFGIAATSPASLGGAESATGDFDGDGSIDVVVSSSQTSVFRGDGTGSFTRETAIGSKSSAVAAGYLDADGHLDLVTLDFDQRSLEVSLGDGRAAFSSSGPFFVARQGQPHDLALADLDGDGVLDLGVISLGDYTLTVLHGNGGGRFTYFDAYDTFGSEPWNLIFADWNADGILDAATGNDTSGNVSVLLGSGNGAFGTARLYATEFGTSSPVAADYDRDGNLDLAALHPNQAMDATLVSVFRGAGDGTFSETKRFRVGNFRPGVALRQSFTAAAGDVNEDGREDLVVANASAGEVAILLGTPFGHCAPAR